MIRGLRQPGRILLLSCYELGHSPSGLAMPAAFLRRAGFEPAALDLSVQRIDPAAFEAAGLVAISVPMHTALRLGARAAAIVRKLRPEAHICFFGLYAPLHREHLREALGPVSVLGGESEAELVALAERLDRGEPAETSSVALARQSFPTPARDGLPRLEHYARLETAAGERLVAGYTETSRGCLDTCRHCPVPSIYDGRFFVIPRERVLEDVAWQVEQGARHITFGDPDFLNGPGHGMKVLRALHRRFPGVTFDVTTQIRHLLRHRDLLPELAELGCAFVVSAVESLSDQVLAALKKRHRRADVEEALSLCRGAGLVLRPTFVPFTPWTTLEDARELVDFLDREDLVAHVDPVQLSVRLLCPPGSLLLEEEETARAFGPLDPRALTHRWEHGDPRVDRLQREIAGLVEGAADREEEPTATFDAIRGLVYRACRLPLPPARPRRRRRVPRVTEPWFC